MAPFLLANFLATLYFVFYFRGLRPPYRYGTKYNVARKLAKRNGAIIYAKAGTFGLGYLGSRVPVVIQRTNFWTPNGSPNGRNHLLSKLFG